MSDRTAEIRRAVLEWLREGHASRFAESELPLQLARTIDARLIDVWEALWGLFGDGLIFLDPAGQQAAGSWDNWRWRLTDVGKEVVETGSWHPRDPDRFLARMRERAPGLDAAALGYLEEALHVLTRAATWPHR